MNWRAIRTIVRKDLKVVLQNKAVSVPMIIVPAIFLVIMPLVMGILPSAATQVGSPLSGLDSFLANMPAGLQAELSTYNDSQKFVVVGLVYFLAPFYMILPLLAASVIATDSFVGEKERRTLEALLYTPTTDRELFIAKVLSAWIPAVVVALVGLVIYSIVANVAAWGVMGHIFFPNLMWLVLALWVAPAVAGLGLGVSALVSARAQTFQEANQLASLVVLPVVALVIGQAAGVMYFSVGLVLLLGLGLWIVDVALLWFGGRTFRRSELIAKI